TDGAYGSASMKSGPSIAALASSAEKITEPERRNLSKILLDQEAPFPSDLILRQRTLPSRVRFAARRSARPWPLRPRCQCVPEMRERGQNGTEPPVKCDQV